jgi:hypothetical protein
MSIAVAAGQYAAFRRAGYPQTGVSAADRDAGPREPGEALRRRRLWTRKRRLEAATRLFDGPAGSLPARPDLVPAACSRAPRCWSCMASSILGFGSVRECQYFGKAATWPNGVARGSDCRFCLATPYLRMSFPEFCFTSASRAYADARAFWLSSLIQVSRQFGENGACLSANLKGPSCYSTCTSRWCLPKPNHHQT